MRLLAEQRTNGEISPDVSQPIPSRALDRDTPSTSVGSPPAAETLAAALAALPPPPSADDDQAAGHPLSSLASLALTTSDCEFILNTRKLRALISSIRALIIFVLQVRVQRVARARRSEARAPLM
jgi:hypothetical protein